MRIEPSHGVHPVFSSWLERRRDRMRAQMQAIDEERFDDLADLLGEDEEDRPPTPQSEGERQEYRRMLADSQELAARLAEIRGRLLAELKDVERRQGHVLPRDGRSGRGGSLDGYL